MTDTRTSSCNLPSSPVVTRLARLVAEPAYPPLCHQVLLRQSGNSLTLTYPRVSQLPVAELTRARDWVLGELEAMEAALFDDESRGRWRELVDESSFVYHLLLQVKDADRERGRCGLCPVCLPALVSLRVNS